MRTVALPSGEHVPALGLGTWHLGEHPNTRAEEIATLRLGLDLGVTLIDTAEMYGDGRAEALIAKAVGDRRDEVFLVSKVLPQHASRRIQGVRNVTNEIALKPTVVASDIKRKIEEAFERSAQIDASGVMVEANGSEVILKGRVRTWAERQEAERAAWAAPGVTKVDNQIKITG